MVKIMKLPGGNVEDSISVAAVLVEGEILHPPPRSENLPLIALLDFPLTAPALSSIVSTNLSSTEDIENWSRFAYLPHH